MIQQAITVGELYDTLHRLIHSEKVGVSTPIVIQTMNTSFPLRVVQTTTVDENRETFSILQKGQPNLAIPDRKYLELSHP